MKHVITTDAEFMALRLECRFDWGDEWFTIEYSPYRANMFGVGASEDGLAGIFAEVITSWDVTDDVGVRLPITAETIETFDEAFAHAMMLSVIDDIKRRTTNLIATRHPRLWIVK